jgi:LacI family transcriptional regulator
MNRLGGEHDGPPRLLGTMEDPGKIAGIKDIAKALGVSIGTVDRALHGRSGVSAKTKVRVLQMAGQLGYRPNLAAQALKLNRRLSIAAILPKHISHFFDPLRAGIRAAAATAVGMHINLEFHEYPRLGVGDVEAFEAALHRKYDGIIFLPGDTRTFDPLIRKLSRAGTAMLCVGSDAPNSERIGSVAAHAYVSGAIAAELLSYKLDRKAHVVTITGDLATLDHAEKLRGFAATLAVLAPHLSLLPVLESHEKPKEAYRQTLALMQGKTRPEGLYVNTANSMPVLRVLEELGLLGKVQVVTTDLFQELVPLIERGKVLATLYQRPYTQGKLAFESLLAHLLEGGNPQPVVRLAPHVIFRSNLSLFAGQVADSDDEISTELAYR